MDTLSTVLFMLISIYIQQSKCSTPIISEISFDAAPAGKAGLSVAEVIEAQGFSARTYKIESVKGYLVAATRVINPLADSSGKKQVVVIHHGFLANPINPQLVLGAYSKPRKPSSEESGENANDPIGSDDGNSKEDKLISATSLRNNCLAYYLSNNNYDVWLLHARGATSDSSGNIDKKFELSEEYWDFNLDDQSQYDLPAQIDFIRAETGQDKVAYIGYSESTMLMFQLLSAKPEFGKTRLSTYIAVAPVVYLEHVQGTLRDMPASYGSSATNTPLPGSLSQCVQKNTKLLGYCANQTVTTSACKPRFEKVGGPGWVNIYNKVELGQNTSPTSTKAALQFNQYIKNPVLQKYDYGREGNLKHYNQETPPKYDLSAVTFDKIVFVRSTGNDIVSNKQDQERLIGELKVPLYKDIVTPSYYNHFSFFQAYNNYEYVVKPIYEVIKDTLKCNVSNKRDYFHYFKRLFYSAGQI